MNFRTLSARKIIANYYNNKYKKYNNITQFYLIYLKLLYYHIYDIHSLNLLDHFTSYQCTNKSLYN